MTDLTIVIANKTYSSWSLRGWLAVRHTGLPHKEVKLALDTPEFYTEIEKYSAARKVPLLIDDTVKVWDSAAIIDYCALLSPEKYWWPTEKAAYAFARSICAEMHSGFTAIRTHLPMNMRLAWQGNFSKGVERNIKRIDTIWTECRERFGGTGSYLFGDFSAADIMYAPVVSRFLTYSVPLSAKAQAYAEAVRTHPDMKDWYEEALKETSIVAVDEIDRTATMLG